MLAAGVLSATALATPVTNASASVRPNWWGGGCATGILNLKVCINGGTLSTVIANGTGVANGGPMYIEICPTGSSTCTQTQGNHIQVSEPGTSSYNAVYFGGGAAVTSPTLYPN